MCTAGTLQVEGTGWRNSTGTITNGGGTLVFAGTFTRTDLGTCTHAGGTTRLTGTMTNTGTFTLGPATTGSWEITNNGRIIGGAVATTGGTELRVTGNGYLEGVALSAAATVRVTGTMFLVNYAASPIDANVFVDVGGYVQTGTGGMITGNGTFDVTGGGFYSNNSASWGFGPGITVRFRGAGTSYLSQGYADTCTVQGILRLEDSRSLHGQGPMTLVNQNRVELLGTGQLYGIGTSVSKALPRCSPPPVARLQATTIDLQAGTVEGTGTLAGNVTNAGTIRPGGNLALGALTIQGNFTQTAGGTLAIELGGTTATTYDRLLLTGAGAATFAGTLATTLFGGFTPVAGNTFDPVTYTSRTGTLTIQSPPGHPLTPTYNPTALRLTR
ncbi:MAG: hypothetical protein IPK26_29835 [Planctomycetes bacterium]|nr:hypothetical protein [Planctomycetota bacterium]